MNTNGLFVVCPFSQINNVFRVKNISFNIILMLLEEYFM